MLQAQFWVKIKPFIALKLQERKPIRAVKQFTVSMQLDWEQKMTDFIH